MMGYPVPYQVWRLTSSMCCVQNRAKCQLALQAGKFYTSVDRVCVWGNHSTTQVCSCIFCACVPSSHAEWAAHALQSSAGLDARVCKCSPGS